jgi:hypothetical protein
LLRCDAETLVFVSRVGHSDLQPDQGLLYLPVTARNGSWQATLWRQRAEAAVALRRIAGGPLGKTFRPFPAAIVAPGQ